MLVDTLSVHFLLISAGSECEKALPGGLVASNVKHSARRIIAYEKNDEVATCIMSAFWITAMNDDCRRKYCRDANAEANKRWVCVRHCREAQKSLREGQSVQSLAAETQPTLIKIATISLEGWTSKVIECNRRRVVSRSSKRISAFICTVKTSSAA